ncbi:MAG: glutamate cyclase domain-containing protein [Halopseudomonas aestusnigri]
MNNIDTNEHPRSQPTFCTQSHANTPDVKSEHIKETRLQKARVLKEAKLAALIAKGGDASKVHHGNMTKLKNVGYVDSGIGGAMAAKLIPGSTHEFGSVICLPIGDKEHQKIVNYTAQMVLETFIGQKKDHVVIACNTASTVRGEAFEVANLFIMSQAENPEQSIYSDNPEKLGRLLDFAAAIGEDQYYLDDHVHSVVEPTAEKLAYEGLELLEGLDKAFVRIDSTDGTVKNGAYINEMLKQVTSQAASFGYKVEEIEQGTTHLNVEGEPRNDTDAKPVHNLKFTLTKGEETKYLYVQNRGNQKWVPAIEGNESPERFEELAKESTTDASAAMESSLDNTDFNLAFDQESTDPELIGLCCTHYPKMKKPLITIVGNNVKPAFVEQTEIVRDIVYNLVDENGKRQIDNSKKDPDAAWSTGPDHESPVLTVMMGNSAATDADRKVALEVLKTIYEGVKGITIQKLSASDGAEYEATYKIASFLVALESQSSQREEKLLAILDDSTVPDYEKTKCEQLFYARSNDKFVEEQVGKIGEPGSANVRWGLDSTRKEPTDRAVARVISSIPTSLSQMGNRVMKAVRNLVGSTPYNPLSVSTTRVLSALMQIGRLGVTGENRGLDRMAVTLEPGEQLLAAGTAMAQIVVDNSTGEAEYAEMSSELKKNVGIVTGFTVVDNATGTPIAGENDGPPGAVSMAKSLFEKGTPVTLVVDTGSEASMVTALMGANIEGVVNYNDGDARTHIIANMDLPAGLDILVVAHEEGMYDLDKDIEILRVEDELFNRLQTTSLMIGIERPSPNVSGTMADMSNNDIRGANADLSQLFQAREGLQTIGIWDGGNEIGAGVASDTATTVLKPDGTTVVKNGPKIAATVSTDISLPASNSNLGGLLVSIAMKVILNEQEGGTQDLTSMAREDINTHKAILDYMEKQEMSIDGVRKENLPTLDGRLINRPKGAPVREPGDDGATHDDMYDKLLSILKHAGGETANAEGFGSKSRLEDTRTTYNAMASGWPVTETEAVSLAALDLATSQAASTMQRENPFNEPGILSKQIPEPTIISTPRTAPLFNAEDGKSLDLQIRSKL